MDFAGTIRASDSSDHYETTDKGYIIFSLTNGNGNGTARGHLDANHASTTPTPCTLSGTVDYAWAYTAFVDHSSGNVTFQADSSAPSPTPQYFMVTGVSGSCVGQSASVLTSAPFGAFGGAADSLGSGAANVKLQDGASWHFNYDPSSNFSERLNGTIYYCPGGLCPAAP